MKTRVKIISVFFAAIAACLALTACTDDTDAPERVVISAPAEVASGTTLLKLMEERAAAGELSFIVENGMVTSLCGRKAFGSNYWLLYTDDGDHGNSDWGAVEHEGKTYYSATLGAESLPVVGGCTYIWVYTRF